MASQSSVCDHQSQRPRILPLTIRVQVEVAIHSILYVRQIYPADLFIRRKKYDTPVFQSRHPALNDYISGAVKAIREQLLTVRQQLFRHIRPKLLDQGNLEKVVVVIKDKEEVALERFLFSIEHMIQVEAFNKDTRFVQLAASVVFKVLSLAWRMQFLPLP